MRVSAKGQVTIPKNLRDLAGIAANSEVVFSVEGGRIFLEAKDGGERKADRQRLARFLAALDRLEGTGDQTLSADDVMRETRDR